MSKCHTILPARTSLHAFLISNAFFLTQPQCCVTFQMNLALVLLKCRSFHIDIILQRQVTTFCIFLSLSTSKSVYVLCDPFFITILIFVTISTSNRMASSAINDKFDEC